MRVTQSMYYKNMYGTTSSQLQTKLFDVNKQIASGVKMQYAYEDVTSFSETMRLDNEINILGQVKKSVDSGYKVSNQTDTVLNDFESSIERAKVLLIQAASDVQSESSTDAIAKELRGIEKNLKNLANTSINGKFLFSGSAIDTKPIRDDGIYMGNAASLNSFLGAGISQKYNLSGAELFLGEESSVKREITSNVPQYNLSSKYPKFSDASSDLNGTIKAITTTDSIRDLMGDIDDVVNKNAHFYIRGVQSNGTSFNKQITMNDSQKVSELLEQIGNAYGNTASIDVVNVSMNNSGEIVIQDKLKGSSKLEFHMVGAIDFNQDITSDLADVNNQIYGVQRGEIENLAGGETNFDKIINKTSDVAHSKLYVKSFVQSSYDVVPKPQGQLQSVLFSMTPGVSAGSLDLVVKDKNGGSNSYSQAFTIDANTTYTNLKNQIESDGDFTVEIVGDSLKLTANTRGLTKSVSIQTALVNTGGAISIASSTQTSIPATDIDALFYDTTKFTKSGALVSSSISQIITDTNAFATPSTKISEVADLSQITAGTLDGTVFSLSGVDINGSVYTAEINFKNTANGGSTFSIDTNADGIVDKTFDIFDMGNPRVAVNADDMTYQQLMDVTNMIVANNLPANSNTLGDDTQEVLDYDKAIKESQNLGSTFLSYDGKIQFKDTFNTASKVEISLYDKEAGDFGSSLNASVMTFNANNALAISDAKTDFFKEFDALIDSVENYKMHPDTNGNSKRDLGIQNGITVLDNLRKHVSRAHSTVGTQSGSLINSLERTQVLEISTMTLRSSVIDTDIAEASLTLTQLSFNYEAMLSTVGKVSKLSLVNYL
ncbi:flagellar biosynthesis protein FlgL [Sulfurimonas sp. SAG-AH-194-I05]|nr:flagellar biosynthesis protein FlgL [Sulfurimonas sp. SAG-AH-194-I05]MDF1876073.1 flagellar biosynthesis protein FlgL [Sulfurimonas sp. SAG-AH-194-I05]